VSDVSVPGPGRGAPLRAILLPSYQWNPYQRLLASALREAGVEATAVHRWSQRAPILGTWWSQGRPDVVHLHWIHEFLGGSRGTPSSWRVRWFGWQLRLLKALGVRLVWTVHNLKGHEASGEDANDAAAHRCILEQADAIILHCEYARDALVELYQPSPAARARMHVLPHGSYVRQYDVDADQAAARRALGLPDGGTVFAFVGSIRGYKNVGELLDAFMSVEELRPDDRLLIAGKPLPRKLGRQLEKLAAEDRRIVLQLDRLPEEELSRTLRAADAVVLPFRDILTSGSAILALSHGRPVIAPAMGCLPSTLPPDATFLYDPDAEGALAGALREAAEADLAAMGQQARAFAETIEWGPIAQRTAALYRGGEARANVS
jgi:glycosyltransferase involved in cell wall biosynthesis